MPPEVKTGRCLQKLEKILNRPSLRGAKATTQSSFFACGAMNCFAELVIGRTFSATRWLAMTD